MYRVSGDSRGTSDKIDLNEKLNRKYRINVLKISRVRYSFLFLLFFLNIDRDTASNWI